jgi:protein SCO1/2
MAKRHKWGGAALALFIGAAALAGPREPLEPGSSAKPVTADIAPEIPPTSFLSNLKGMDLVDQYGRPFRLSGLVDRVVLFNFIFTHCRSVCPMQTGILSRVFQDLPADVRDQVRFVSVSVDPANDTPERLRHFSETLHADMEGWSFLTGDVQQLARLTQRLHLLDESDAGQANQPRVHRTSLWLVDKRGRMLQRYSGDPPEKERQIEELTRVSRMVIR